MEEVTQEGAEQALVPQIDQQKLVVIRSESVTLPEEAEKFLITNDEEYEAVSQWLRIRCKSIIDEIRALFSDTKKERKRLHSEICDQENAALKEPLEAEVIIKDKMDKYLKERKRKADEAAQKVADELRLQALARAEEARKNGEAAPTAQQIQQQTQSIAATLQQETRTPPKVAGTGASEKWFATLVDLDQFLNWVTEAGLSDSERRHRLEYVVPNDKAIQDHAKNAKERFSIPGYAADSKFNVSSRKV